MVSPRLRVLPTSWRPAGRRFFDPGGRPGPGLPGFGAPAGQAVAWRMFRNPRRTRAGVQPAGRAGPFPGQAQVFGERPGEAELGVAAMTSQVHRSAAAGSRIFGAVQPRTCLNSRKVCSRSKPDCIHRCIWGGPSRSLGLRACWRWSRPSSGCGRRRQVREWAAVSADAACPPVNGFAGRGAAVGGVPADEPGAGGVPAEPAGRADDGAGGSCGRRVRG